MKSFHFSLSKTLKIILLCRSWFISVCHRTPNSIKVSISESGASACSQENDPKWSSWIFSWVPYVIKWRGDPEFSCYDRNRQDLCNEFDEIKDKPIRVQLSFIGLGSIEVQNIHTGLSVNSSVLVPEWDHSYNFRLLSCN